jgi:hypothetical protein
MVDYILRNINSDSTTNQHNYQDKKIIWVVTVKERSSYPNRARQQADGMVNKAIGIFAHGCIINTLPYLNSNFPSKRFNSISSFTCSLALGLLIWYILQRLLSKTAHSCTSTALSASFQILLPGKKL